MFVGKMIAASLVGLLAQGYVTDPEGVIENFRNDLASCGKIEKWTDNPEYADMIPEAIFYENRRFQRQEFVGNERCLDNALVNLSNEGSNAIFRIEVVGGNVGEIPGNYRYLIEVLIPPVN